MCCLFLHLHCELREDTAAPKGLEQGLERTGLPQSLRVLARMGSDSTLGDPRFGSQGDPSSVLFKIHPWQGEGESWEPYLSE